MIPRQPSFIIFRHNDDVLPMGTLLNLPHQNPNNFYIPLDD